MSGSEEKELRQHVTETITHSLVQKREDPPEHLLELFKGHDQDRDLLRKLINRLNEFLEAKTGDNQLIMEKELELMKI